MFVPGEFSTPTRLARKSQGGWEADVRGPLATLNRLGLSKMIIAWPYRPKTMTRAFAPVKFCGIGTGNGENWNFPGGDVFRSWDGWRLGSRRACPRVISRRITGAISFCNAFPGRCAISPMSKGGCARHIYRSPNASSWYAYHCKLTTCALIISFSVGRRCPEPRP